MTREEAINVLENPDVSIGVAARIGQDPEYWKKLKPALDMAISALRQRETVTERHKLTNADRIRAMSDEELVVFLDEFSGRCLDCAEGAWNKNCPIYKDGHYCRPKDIMEWLQQPAEEDDHETNL